jgi:polar amino acid transport system substrate-binding protein
VLENQEFPMVRRSLAALAALGLTGTLAACAPASDSTDAESTPAATASTTQAAGAIEGCSPEDLETLEPGTLTVATDDPAYEPWFVDNDPANQEGFEAAVAYAVASTLGYSEDEVTWTRVPFSAAIQPGPKTFDFDINQFSITDERKQAVDFSSPYYDVQQAVIAVDGSPALDATTLADLQEVRLGAQVGTTSYQAIESVVAPTVAPSVFNTNEDAVTALKNGQVDAIVVDLPTAFFLTSVELSDVGGTIVGQLPPTEGETEQFGLVLDLGSPLTSCVSQAVDALREDGTLADLENEWLADVAGAPVLG